MGILLLGPSGIGKSECALELVARGHRLVADDVVRLRREGDRLIGEAPPGIRHFTEIRGLGLLFVPDLYGPDAVADTGAVDLVCHLEPWRTDVDYERVGAERPLETLVGLSRPQIVLPVRPATSMATLLEVAARDHRARGRGADCVRELARRSQGGAGSP